jgi:hypothetical protein
MRVYCYEYFEQQKSSDSQSLDASGLSVTDDDKNLMQRYGITFEEKTVHYFYYEGYKYDKLGDAVNYARIQTARRK